MLQRIVVDVDKELWRQASIMAAEMSIKKKVLLQEALREYIARRRETLDRA